MQLTNKQNEVLYAIRELSALKGMSPTLRELQDYLGYKNTSSVQRHTDALKKKGYILSNKYESRSLTLGKEIEKKHNIPLVGSVSCGAPFLAVENIEAYIPYEISGNSDDYFFLRAVGDSMNQAGIDDGDMVLIKKQNTADNGDMVVALIEDDAVIKIFKKNKNCVSLEPKSSNKIHKPIYIFDNLQIQGKVADVLKTNN